MLCLKQMGDTAASPPGDDLRLAAGDSASDEEGADGADGGEAATGGGGRRHNNTLARALCGLLASLADRLKCGRQNRKRQVSASKDEFVKEGGNGFGEILVVSGNGTEWQT
ncbi:uncharacterized protein LOC134776548 [Penaeus indicus]|uniref:uncharacterized protein LOC134776548 n=1 Tax=Penaeus indicus TaxID=29960 RepID=UPI00300CBBAC